MERRKSLVVCVCGLLAMISALSPLYAGGGREGGRQELVTLRVLYPGDESKRMESFLANEFKQRIAEELNIGIEVSYSPWDQYWNKKDLMLAAGEQLDWYWEYSGSISKIVSQKQYYPLNDLIEKYGSNLKRVIPADNFKAFTFGGTIVAIPTAYAPTSETLNSALVRQDLLEGVGMKELRSAADLEQFFAKAKVKYPEKNAVAGEMYTVLTRDLGDPVIFAGGPISIDPVTSKALSYFESDVFRKCANMMASWKKKGYVPDDVTLKYMELLGRMTSGNYLVCNGAISRPMENIGELRANAPEARLKEYLLSPEKPRYKFFACSNFICIGPKSRYPEKATMFLNWVYESKDNYLFTLYGVDGKDYKIENGRLKLLSTDTLFYEWMFRNINYMEFPDNVDDDFIATFKNWDKGCVVPPAFGFTFDSTPVKSEEAKINSVIQEKFVPIETGFVDYDTAYPDAQKALKSAGIDKYVAEYQKQLDAYIGSNR
jgi:putative aldouronate transport system substrate-binding protein